MERHTHNVFIINGMVDEEVVKKQAYDRAMRNNEDTSIHYHRLGGACSDKCYLVVAAKVKENQK